MTSCSPAAAPMCDAEVCIGNFNGIVEGALLSLVACMVLHAGDADAQVANAHAGPTARHPGVLPPQSLRTPDALLPLNELYPDLKMPEAPTDPNGEFRPRAHYLWEAGPDGLRVNTRPDLQSTTAWQRMRDYRSWIGVRVLTLWESGGNTVSLQAGKHGGPSLQWSSGTFKRGDASRGLLDHIFSVATVRAADKPPNPRSPPRIIHLPAPGVLPAESK